MSRYGQWILPVVVAVSAITYLAAAMTPAEDPAGSMNLHGFGQLPIVDRGRVKPIDAMARTDLTLISGRQTFYDEEKKEHSAVEWMLDVLTSRPPFKNPAAAEHKVFRIENEQVLSLLDLPPKPGSYRYSLQEMGKKWEELDAALHRSGEKKEQDKFDQKLLELGEHLKLHIELAEMDSPLLLDPADPKGKPRSLREVVTEWSENARADKEKGADVATLAASMPPFLKLLLAYQADKPADFNKELTAYQQQLETALPAETHKAAFEAWFNDFAPFYQCTFLYVCVFVLTCFSWIGVFSKPLNWSALVLTGVTLIVHTGALIARMYMMDRWGVVITNLYGTAIYIGWMSVVIGFIVELIFGNGIGTFVASTAGFLTMIIAQYLAMGEDTMEMMRAVLDTNFWLATHVTAVNTGYAGTLFAGLLGAVFVMWGAFTPWQSKSGVKMIGDILYGVLCFATLFSFTGTVLGGIWADQSWGRFWGWDPKENGALLIVVWNALILHARWGGMVKQRGMAVLALMGNIIVIWSWWGVNMLGVGLHAYANADANMLMAVNSGIAVHLVFIAVGLTPRSLWMSYNTQQAIPLPPPSAPNRRPRGRGRTDIKPEPA